MKQPQPKRPAPVPVKPSTSQPREEESVTRARLLKQIQAMLDRDEIPTVELETVAEFVTIIERDRGCSTPAENFIVTLVEMYCWGHATPDVAALKLEDFRSDFDYAITTAQFMNARYPDQVAANSEEEDRQVA